MLAWIGMGANLGDRAGTLLAAFARIAALPGVSSCALSPCYASAPMGPPQPDYLNACARADIGAWSPRDFLAALAAIETAFGRERGEHWGPRTLDLDLLLVEGVRSEDPRMMLPHPGIRQRAFVMRPLLDLDPGLRDPVDGRSYRELLADLGEGGLRPHPWPAGAPRG